MLYTGLSGSISGPMLEIDCRELSADEELALTAELTDALMGKAVSFFKGGKIVFDNLSATPLDAGVIETAVKDFLSRRKDAEHYSVERNGNLIVVHSPDPIAASHRRRVQGLPPNVYQCPFCPFVTPHQELYVVHYGSHGFV